MSEGETPMFSIKKYCGTPSIPISVERYPDVDGMDACELKNMVCELSNTAYLLLQERNDLKFLNAALIKKMGLLNSSLIKEVDALRITLESLKV